MAERDEQADEAEAEGCGVTEGEDLGVKPVRGACAFVTIKCSDGSNTKPDPVAYSGRWACHGCKWSGAALRTRTLTTLRKNRLPPFSVADTELEEEKRRWGTAEGG